MSSAPIVLSVRFIARLLLPLILRLFSPTFAWPLFSGFSYLRFFCLIFWAILTSFPNPWEFVAHF